MQLDYETKKLSLKQPRKNIRKHVDKTSGHKKPRLLDYDYNTTIVESAPDSISNAPTSTPKTYITLSPLGISLSTGNISNTGTRRLSLNKSRKLSYDNNINSGLPSQNNDDSKKNSLKLSLNGEEEKVKAENISQTTPSLRNKPTLEKVNSAPKGSNQ